MSSNYADWNQGIIDEFRANNGVVAQFGGGLVLLHHVGAKSGTHRISPVMGIQPDADTWWIAASKAGSSENSGWYHNLIAHPTMTIEVPDEGVVEVTATVLPRDERDAAWAQFTALSPGFRQYEQATTRIIPVIALRRASAAS